MDIRRVALIYDDKDRPETTGVYCRRALESMVDVVHFRADDVASIPRSGFDLYLHIDDGLEYQLPANLHPSAWWAIDTHLNFEWCRRKAKLFDFVFAAQRDGARALEAEGVAPAEWLPLACDPEVHRRFDVDKVHDIAFVGNVFPGPRAELIALLQRRFRSMFVGRAYFEEMAKTHSAARLVFNRSLKNDVNMRIFEAVACGSLLLTNDLGENGQDELFRDGVHLATYRDADELLDKAAYYLDHDALRERIAAAGRAEAIARHTYRHRMQTLLERASRGGPRPRARQHVPESNIAAATPGYYEFARPELLALVPASATRVLDVGCGAGRLGESIKARQAASVVGIEVVPEAAARARDHLDEVFEGDVERLELPFTDAAFDCVVCADVLEHLCDPERFLQRVRNWLTPAGRVVASLPNVRHHSVVSALLEGNWSYEPAGLLDETHLSFFTRRDMVDLFERAGFQVAEIRLVPGPGYDEWRRSGRPGEVRVGRLHIADMSPVEAEEFFVYQYLIVAAPMDAALTRHVNGSGHGSHEKIGNGSLKEPDGLYPAITGRRESATCVEGLRIAFLGNFEQTWSTEGYAADALERVGHTVHRIHEYGVASAAEVLEQIERSRADCLLFFKGRIGVDPSDLQSVLRPDPTELLTALRRSPVPCYLWYYDRVHEYAAEPTRLDWMRRVAPLCRVAFVTDGGLASTDWANWHVLRQGMCRPSVTMIDFLEQDRDDLAFVGQLYGARWDEMALVRKELKVNVISRVFGRELSPLIRKYRIILGPRYPSAPGYWSDRIYVVLGHSGFFLAPVVPGMRDEGLEPGVHYAPLGDDPISDIRYWLDRPEERSRIARQGQELVLGRFTYEDRVRELCAVITATLKKPRVDARCASNGTHTATKGAPSPAGRITANGASSRRFASTGALPFRHRRKLGDIIYSLPVVRHLGGGVLFLDPMSLDGGQDQAYWRRQFATLIPYLKQQPYLSEVRIHQGEAFDVDLDAYLHTTHGTPGDRVSIAANHFIGLGLEVPDEFSPWLVADRLPMTYPIVVHRSPRYHGSVDYSFLLDAGTALYCAGSAEERAPFEAIGVRPLITKDVRELAAVINACAVFIGNQSLPLALAAGLGKPRMVEESDRLPNVSFGGPDEHILTNLADQNRAGLRTLLERSGCGAVSLPRVATAIVG